MATRHRDQKLLTVKTVEKQLQPGRYAAGGGIYLQVSPNGARSWVHLFRWRGKRKEMGLGSFPEVSLAKARELGGANRGVIASGKNPIEARRTEREREWLADKRNLTFLAVGEDFINKKSSGPRPWWCPERAQNQRNILRNTFKPLHNLPINSAEAAEVITLRLHELLMEPIKHRTGKHEPGPRWHTTPQIALAMKHLAYNIGKNAHALKVLPISVANPGAEPLDALLVERQPESGHLQAIHFSKVPSLYSVLDRACEPAHDYFTYTEAQRAVGETHSHKIRKKIQSGELPAIEAPPSLPALKQRKLVGFEVRMMPADLYKVFPMVIDAIPGIRSVIYDLIKFCALNGPRPIEARKMKWTQWDEDERLWTIDWHDTKEGEHIQQPMVIPLSNPSNDIVLKMRDIQRRYKIDTPYVFANYPSRFTTNAKIGQPPCNVTALDQLRRSLHEIQDQLTPDELKGVMHGFRTNIRSWGEQQRNADGTPRFAEKDLERALGHAAGFGKTKVARDYSRQSSDIVGLIPIFDGWAKFITTAKPLASTPSDRSCSHRAIRMRDDLGGTDASLGRSSGSYPADSMKG